jgi:DMSO/TMAO reductase YedYZ molybdopterin-dependent catalytic subunit
VVIAKRRWRAVAGIVAAGVALATTEIVSSIVDRRRPSVIASVASRVVVAWAGPLKDLAVRLFGAHDKAALVAGIVVVSLACGALVGLLSPARRWLAVVTFTAFGLIGVWAAWRDPTASAPDAVVSAIAGTIAGTSSLLALARITRGEHRRSMAAARGTATTPMRTAGGEFDRRRFLAASGGLTAFALGATATSQLLSRTTRTRRSNAVADDSLPVAKRTTPIPIDDAATTVDGLPPYVTPNESFYRIDTAIFVPRVDVRSWTLTIGGRVDRPRTHTYRDLLAMDLVEEPVTIACVSNDVGGHLVGNARWLGVPLSDLLGPAGVQAGATQIVGRSVDDFTVGIPTAQALDGRVALVAVGMNGEPLPAVHGYPARLIVADA